MAETGEAKEEAFKTHDFLLHGSGPGIVGQKSHHRVGGEDRQTVWHRRRDVERRRCRQRRSEGDQRREVRLLPRLRFARARQVERRDLPDHGVRPRCDVRLRSRERRRGCRVAEGGRARGRQIRLLHPEAAQHAVLGDQEGLRLRREETRAQRGDEGARHRAAAQRRHRRGPADADESAALPRGRQPDEAQQGDDLRQAARRREKEGRLARATTGSPTSRRAFTTAAPASSATSSTARSCASATASRRSSAATRSRRARVSCGRTSA